MTVQVVNVAGQEIALLPLAEYQRLIDIAEDLDDIAAADRANERRARGEEYVPIELADRIMAGEHPLRVWRQYRGLTQTQLASRVGTSKMTISTMERGSSSGSLKVWRALSETLNVSLEDILPDTGP